MSSTTRVAEWFKDGLVPAVGQEGLAPPGPVPEDQLASLTSPRRKPSEEKGEQEEGSSPTLPRDSRFPGTQPSPDEPAGLLGHWREKAAAPAAPPPNGGAFKGPRTNSKQEVNLPLNKNKNTDT